MTAPALRDFPLFPLGIVALPSESVPLHIFEHRYLRMIAHCMEGEGREFGILWLSDEELKETGCACTVEQVLERLPDGRMDILARGTRPFTLLERQDDLPYPAGVVEFAAEETEEPDDDAGASARELYGELVAQATDRELSADELAELDSYRMAGDRRVRAAGQAAAARAALGERPPAPARDAPGRGDRAPRAARARAGESAIERQGPLRLISPECRQSCCAVCRTSSCSLWSTGGWWGESSENSTVPSASRTW